MSQRSAHEPALDGLRGVAAAIVVIRHSFNAQWISPEWRMALAESPVAILLNGQGAVQLFFVLSGFVLAGSLARRSEDPPWLRFFVRRIFRIHPPYVAAVLLAIACAALVGNAPAVTLHQGWPALPNAADLARFLAFPGKAGGFLPVGWTLTIELVFSFAMPLLVLAAGFARGLPLLAVCIALLFGVDHDFARYAIDFALGVVAFQQRDAIAAGFARVGAAGRAALVLLGLVLWCAPLLFWARILHGYLIAGWFPYEIATMAAGSVLLLLCAVEVPSLRRVLATPTGRFLGRISYASYLLHWIVITLLAPRLVDRSALGNVALLVGVLVATTLLSMPFQRFVEQPSIDLGARLTRRGGPRPSRSA